MIFVYILLISLPLSIAQDIANSTSVVPQSHNQTLVVKKRDLIEDCPINMEMIENNGRSECQCVSGYFYSSRVRSCFEPYTRGPCNDGEYFVHQPGEFLAECLPNPCEEQLGFNRDSCRELKRSGLPCGIGKHFVYDDETFELTCQKIDITITITINVYLRRCRRYWKRDYRGRCRRVYY